MKSFIKIICIGLLLSAKPANNLTNRAVKIKKIVLDPGHGGKDPGALGKFSKEKDIVLKIALELGKIIQSKMEGVTVLYTRQKDEFIPIYQRSQEANENNADIFISIHCNATTNRLSTLAKGFEVFAMGLEKSAENLAVTKSENSAILVEDNREEHYQGFDPKSPESHILFSLYQNAYTESSLRLAECIDKGFASYVQRKHRGVKQAPFLVLWRTACPSVLVEVGFITNPEEEKFLNSKEGQKKIAKALFEGLEKYKTTFES